MLFRLVSSSIKYNHRILPLRTVHASSSLLNVPKNKKLDPFSPEYDSKLAAEQERIDLAEKVRCANTAPPPFPEKSQEKLQNDNKKETDKQGLIKTIKSGGVVSITLWVVWNFAWLGIFYILAAFGVSKAMIDFMQANFKSIDVDALETKFRNVYGAWMGTNFIIALILQKLAAPIRVGSYLAVLPFVMKFFKK